MPFVTGFLVIGLEKETLTLLGYITRILSTVHAQDVYPIYCLFKIESDIMFV